MSPIDDGNRGGEAVVALSKAEGSDQGKGLHVTVHENNGLLSVLEEDDGRIEVRELKNGVVPATEGTTGSSVNEGMKGDQTFSEGGVNVAISPVEAALCNPLILQTILAQKGFSEENYRSLRLVSYHFNSVILSSLPFPPPLTLNLSQLFYYEVADEELDICCQVLPQEDYPELSQDLCRRTNLTYKCQAEDVYDNDGDEVVPTKQHLALSKSIAAINAAEFFTRYGTQVQFLELGEATEECLQSIGQLLSSGNCSSLRKLHVYYKCECGAQTNRVGPGLEEESLKETDLDKWLPLTFPTMSNLRTIYLQSSRTILGNCPSLKKLAERLVQSSTNLEDLTICHNMYFSLEQNTKLKSLTFYGDCEREDYDLEEMSRMICETYKTLEELTVYPYPNGTNHVRTGNKDFSNFDLSSGPKLKSLKIRYPRGNPFGSRLTSLSTRYMPSLKSLILSTHHVSSLSHFMQNLPNPANGVLLKTVEILKLDGPVDPKHLIFLKLAFPNLKKLHVIFGREGQVCQSNEISPNFDDILAGLSVFLSLVEIEAKLNFRFQWDQLRRGLTKHGGALFKRGSLKRLKLIAKDDAYLGKDDFLSATEKILLMTQGMESVVFENFTLQTGTAITLYKFIQEKGLPITFVDSPYCYDN